MKAQFSFSSIPTSIQNVIPAGVDTEKLVNAVNSAIGRMQVDSSKVKVQDMRLTKKEAKVSEVETTGYIGRRESALEFVSFCNAVEKLEKVHGIQNFSSLPARYADWMESKFNPSAKVEEETDPSVETHEGETVNA